MDLPLFGGKIAILSASAFMAGTLNSVAGGGSFLTFPMLIFCGVPPVVANASSAVALSPGSFSAAWAYRKDLADVHEVNVSRLVWVSLVGGIFGAWLLLHTPEARFSKLIPCLLLFATLVFAFSKPLSARLRRIWRPSEFALLSIQAVVSIYGGYFGGGLGILILSLLSILGVKSLQAMNGVKTLLSGSLNGAAIILFVWAGKVNWRVTVPMLICAVLGGFFGARFSRRVNPGLLRALVCIIGLSLSLYFFKFGH